MATLPQSLGSEIDDAPETGNRTVETLAAKVRPGGRFGGSGGSYTYRRGREIQFLRSCVLGFET